MHYFIRLLASFVARHWLTCCCLHSTWYAGNWCALVDVDASAAVSADVGLARWTGHCCTCLQVDAIAAVSAHIGLLVEVNDMLVVFCSYMLISCMSMATFVAIVVVRMALCTIHSAQLGYEKA
jgi:hypothetical protein